MNKLKQLFIKSKKKIFLACSLLLIFLLLFTSIILNGSPIRKLRALAAGFSDENFYNCVTSTNLPLENIETLSCNNKNIKNIVGIEKLTNLKKLDLSNNQITSVRLNSNTALEELNLNNNSIETINLTSNTNLIKLLIGHNKLSTLSLEGNLNLKSIFASNNEITSINLGENDKLETLTMQNNNLTSINLTKAINLKYLTIGSPLSSLDITKNTLLEQLSLENTRLYSLDLSKNTALSVFGMYKNTGLSSVNLTALGNLNSVGFGDNGFSSLDFSSNPNLKHITFNEQDVSDTNINISENLLLETLSINAKIRSLSLYMNPILTKLELNNTNLSSLDLSANPNIEDLSLNSNKNLSFNIENYYNLDLRELRMTNFGLSQINISPFTNLKYLDLSKNNLTTLDISNNKKLKNLYIDDNPLFKKNIYVARGSYQDIPNDNIIANGFQKTNDISFASQTGFYLQDNKILNNNSSYLSSGYFNKGYHHEQGANFYLFYNLYSYGISSSKYSVDLSNKTIDFDGLSVSKSSVYFNNVQGTRINGLNLSTSGNNALFSDFSNNKILIKDTSGNTVDTFTAINVGIRRDDANEIAGFPDKNFYKCVINRYNNYYAGGSYLDYDEVISPTKLSRIEVLDCNDYGIVSISGVNKLPGLNTLNVGRNLIYQIDLSNNPNLKNLDVSYNLALTNLNISENAALESLNAKYANLSNVSLTQNTSLKELNLSNNKLESISLGQNTVLEKLDLSYNKLSDINVSSNISLKKLFVNGNNISNIDNLKNTNTFKNLEEFGIGNNKLTSLDINNNGGNLKVLRASNNELTSLKLRNMDKLEELYVSSNKLTGIDVDTLEKLSILDINNNNISKMDNVDYMPNLNFILLWDNPIDDVKNYYLLKGESASFETRISTNNLTRKYSFSSSGLSGGESKVIELEGNKIVSKSIGKEYMSEIYAPLKTYRDILKEPFKYCSSAFELSKIQSTDYYEQCNTYVNQYLRENINYNINNAVNNINDNLDNYDLNDFEIDGSQFNDIIPFTDLSFSHVITVYDVKSSIYTVDKDDKKINAKGKVLNINNIVIDGYDLTGSIENGKLVIKDEKGKVIDSYKLINYKIEQNTNTGNDSQNNNSQSNVSNDIAKSAEEIIKSTLQSNTNSGLGTITTNTQSSKSNSNSSSSNTNNSTTGNKTNIADALNTESLKEELDNYLDSTSSSEDTTNNSKKFDKKFLIIGIVLLLLGFAIAIFIYRKKHEEE